jgi:4-diphosphocytidyl-2-C-methyl-D-erythritol kinase
MITERAPAKVNLVLHVGPRRADGLHELCSLFASLELADSVEVEPLAEGREDRILCPGVDSPNLATAALAAYRQVAASDGPPALDIRIDKHVPVAAGLGGGSADAAAVLRAADALSSDPLGRQRLRELGMRLGADVPSQVEPRHTLVTGAGEHVEPVDLPQADLVLVPQRVGLATANVYAEADRRGDVRARLDPDALRALAASGSLEELLTALENDLEPAARALRPELAAVADGLRGRGAEATLLSGSGPTMIGFFASPHAARAAAEAIEGAILTRLRATPRDASPPAGEPRRARDEGSHRPRDR